MDRGVAEQRIESLRHCFRRIEAKCPEDAQTLATDLDLQDIVSLNLSRAEQVCVDIGAHFISGTQLPPPDTTNRSKVAPIAGAPGQDGAYMAGLHEGIRTAHGSARFRA